LQELNQCPPYAVAKCRTHSYNEKAFGKKLDHDGRSLGTVRSSDSDFAGSLLNNYKHDVCYANSPDSQGEETDDTQKCIKGQEEVIKEFPGFIGIPDRGGVLVFGAVAMFL